MQESTVEILGVSELCDHCAWSAKSPWLYAYLPIGAMLFMLRSMAITGIYLLSFVTPPPLKTSLYKIQKRVLGIKVKLNASLDQIRSHTDGCIVASNHVSMMDAIVSSGLPNATLMIGQPLKQLDIFNRMLITSALNLSGVKQWHVVDRRGLAKNIQRWRKNQSGTTLYTTPEMTIGNQRGIFKFNSAFLCFDLPVVPLAVKVKNPIGLNLCPINSSSKAMLLRLLMLPKIEFHLSYLDALQRSEEESKEDFAKRVQRSIGENLGISATEWTAADKHAYRKQLRARKDES